MFVVIDRRDMVGEDILVDIDSIEGCVGAGMVASLCYMVWNAICSGSENWVSTGYIEIPESNKGSTIRHLRQFGIICGVLADRVRKG